MNVSRLVRIHLVRKIFGTILRTKGVIAVVLQKSLKKINYGFDCFLRNGLNFEVRFLLSLFLKYMVLIVGSVDLLWHNEKVLTLLESAKKKVGLKMLKIT